MIKRQQGDIPLIWPWLNWIDRRLRDSRLSDEQRLMLDESKESKKQTLEFNQ